MGRKRKHIESDDDILTSDDEQECDRLQCSKTDYDTESETDFEKLFNRLVVFPVGCVVFSNRDSSTAVCTSVELVQRQQLLERRRQSKDGKQE